MRPGVSCLWHLPPIARAAKPDRPAGRLAGRLTAAFAELPEHERPPALTPVQDTFAAEEPDAGRPCARDLGPERLRAELPAPAAGLSERTPGMYEDLLGRCAHPVEQLTARPPFASAAGSGQEHAGAERRAADVRRRAGGPRPARPLRPAPARLHEPRRTARPGGLPYRVTTSPRAAE
ncbi:hypothetical protein [Streptomyces sp. NPDC006270]|uniref:NACHT N-terminal Helical domain 1-containing protein n=1 Tax=Streptomyces sp. NPDC006270 TaxID=3364741 RepID=UPI0036ACEED6